MKPPDVSVVVCTYNRARFLASALESLLRQETDGTFCYEIIVVDNASTDDTHEVVRKAMKKSLIPVRYVREMGHGVARARNRGVEESSARWIAFFDDDQRADPSWLKELLRFASQTGAQCVCGAVRLCLPRDEIARLPAICRRVLGETVARHKAERCTRKTYPGTGNVLLRRSLFHTIGLFEEFLKRGGEDQRFFARVRMAGIEAWYTPDAVVHHMIPSYRLTLDYFRWAARRYGDSTAYRDYLEWGPARTTFLLAARVGQALFVNLPLLIRAYICNDQPEILGRKYLLWQAGGYGRQFASLIVPSLLPQQRYFAALDFRAERQRFSRQSNSNDFDEMARVDG